jgi:hypothetical protein
VEERKKPIATSGLVARRASNIIQKEAAIAAAHAQPHSSFNEHSTTDSSADANTPGAPTARRANVAADKFRDPNYTKTHIEKCVCCDKPVYKTEELRSFGALWHKACFVCGGVQEGVGCKRGLANETYEFNGNIAYCKACYLKNFLGRNFPVRVTSSCHQLTAGPSRVAVSAKLIRRSPKKTKSIRLSKVS